VQKFGKRKDKELAGGTEAKLQHTSLRSGGTRPEKPSLVMVQDA